MGVDVVDIGMCGTEEIYFATDHYGFDGGIVVTASHNPKNYNGMKLVREGSRPVSSDSGLLSIKDKVAANSFKALSKKGCYEKLNHRGEYIDHLLSYVDSDSLQPMKIIANPGNGGAGLVMDQLADRLPLEIEMVFGEPDGNFPHGVPNPLLPENRAPTVDAICASRADLGIAWDGDFDRCFLFDENGRFIEGYYIVGLLAQAFLTRYAGAAVVHDPRLVWNTQEVIESEGGRAVMCKAGHAFIKEVMRSEDAIYGGEMSAHHYFKDFAYCDSGMLPWLLVIDLMSRTEMKLSELVDERMSKFPVSGEINRKVESADAVLSRLERDYADGVIDKTDGLSVSFGTWRFNVRASNTEPVIRLNVESRGDRQLMESKTVELLEKMGGEEA